MITRTFYAVQAFILLSVFSIVNSASAQSYHRPIHHIDNLSNMMDSSEITHLQVSIQQPNKENLKFRIVALNPQGGIMNISITKGDDVLFSQNTKDGQYFNTFNFGQLEDGEYKVIVIGGKERISKEIQLHTATIIDRQISIN